ncbi:MAG: uracil-DNA glycosylase [Spirochaetaceae bacterium]|jgi:uracil-DNA glycosylase|nr:uracil-DNA glycosylase [Spirochaetaceae bacterium]
MRLKELITEKSWYSDLEKLLNQPDILQLESFLNEQIKLKKTFYPKQDDIFNVLNYTPLNRVKVVILGQDPYHGPGQAHGLSFSVRPGVPIPPSLLNIYKELKNNLFIEIPNHGFLKSWSDQGVFLLNCTMTVEHSKAGSHQNKGWEIFTDSIISIINEKESPVVFLLWGSYARKKKYLIDNQIHLILEAPHPSPLSAYRGFLGCSHFSQTNEFLKKNGLKEINWQLPENPQDQ